MNSLNSYKLYSSGLQPASTCFSVAASAPRGLWLKSRPGPAHEYFANWAYDAIMKLSGGTNKSPPKIWIGCVL